MIMKTKHFQSQMTEFIKNIPSYRYIFEITKQCGYSELFIIFKDKLLSELYADISLQLQCKIERLYFINKVTNENIDIPNTNEIILRNFIIEQKYLSSIYDMSCPSVFRIYYEVNNDVNNDVNNEVSKNVIIS